MITKVVEYVSCYTGKTYKWYKETTWRLFGIALMRAKEELH